MSSGSEVNSASFLHCPLRGFDCYRCLLEEVYTVWLVDDRQVRVSDALHPKFHISLLENGAL